MTDIFEVPLPDTDLLDKAEQLRLASIKTSQTNNDERIRALNLMADSLQKNYHEIIEANIKDYKNANDDLSEAFKLKKNCPENYLFSAYFLAYSINKNLENSKDAFINLEKAINELIRVCKDTLIVVMPKQKYNKYTFDLHINFFNNRS